MSGMPGAARWIFRTASNGSGLPRERSKKMVSGAANSMVAISVGTVETTLNSKLLPGPGYRARRDAAASPGTVSASNTRSFFPFMRGTSPLADKRAAPRKRRDGMALGCNPAGANPYREATFGETGEDSPQDSKFPQLELLGRG